MFLPRVTQLSPEGFHQLSPLALLSDEQLGQQLLFVEQLGQKLLSVAHMTRPPVQPLLALSEIQ
jgi:hypothetical protein